MATVEVEFKEGSEEARRIANVFELSGEALRQRMKALAAAAFDEYQLEMSGLRSISTIREQRELRLYLLYKHIGLAHLADTQVGELFQFTRTQVGTLIAGTWARFRPELEDQLRDTVEEVLKVKSGWKDNDRVFDAVMPDSVAKFVRDVIAQTKSPPMEKSREVGQTYELQRETVEALCEQLEIDPTGVLP